MFGTVCDSKQDMNIMEGEDNYAVDEDDLLRVVEATTNQTEANFGGNIRTSTQNMQEGAKSGDAVSPQPPTMQDVLFKH